MHLLPSCFMNMRRECETDVIHQTFAKHYAELFNQEVHRQAQETGLGRCGAHDIDFLLTHVARTWRKAVFLSSLRELEEVFGVPLFLREPLSLLISIARKTSKKLLIFWK